jgi:hypothetical protein
MEDIQILSGQVHFINFIVFIILVFVISIIIAIIIPIVVIISSNAIMSYCLFRISVLKLLLYMRI